jgi:hypothetical protein
MRKSKGPTDPYGLSGRRRSSRLKSKYCSYSLPPSPSKSPSPQPSAAICHNLRSRSVAYPSQHQSNSISASNSLSTPTPIPVVSAYESPEPSTSDIHDALANQAPAHASPPNPHTLPFPSTPYSQIRYNRYGPRVRSPLSFQLEPRTLEDESELDLGEDTDMQVDCLPRSDFKPDPTWPKQPPSFSIENPLIPHRPRDRQTDLWKSVCCECLSVVLVFFSPSDWNKPTHSAFHLPTTSFKRYGVETIRDFVRIQAETHGLEMDSSPSLLAPAPASALSFTNTPFPATFSSNSFIQSSSTTPSPPPQPTTWYELHTPDSLLNDHHPDAADVDDDSDSDSDSDTCPDNISMDVDLDNCNLSLSLRAMEPMTEPLLCSRRSSVFALHRVAEMWDCVERHPGGYIGRGTPVDEWRRGQWRLVGIGQEQALQNTFIKPPIAPHSDSFKDVSLDAFLAEQTCRWGPLLQGGLLPGTSPDLGSFPEPPRLLKGERPCEGDVSVTMFTQPSNVVLG